MQAILQLPASISKNQPLLTQILATFATYIISIDLVDIIQFPEKLHLSLTQISKFIAKFLIEPRNR
jgi:hypothetical protein